MASTTCPSGATARGKTRIRRGQYQALRAVNAELVQLYWDIGESIHRKQENLGWGRSVVETATGQNSNHWLEKSAGQRTS
jgi:hypothetical protein